MLQARAGYGSAVRAKTFLESSHDCSAVYSYRTRILGLRSQEVVPVGDGKPDKVEQKEGWRAGNRFEALARDER